MRLCNWPSLAPQIEVATRLFGANGWEKVEAALQQHVERIKDPAFARLFSDHINLPGVHSRDYSHRHIQSKDGQLIGGIRFFARDLARPFVEVMAHDFTNLDALRACVLREWAVFQPLDLRLITAPDAPLPQAGRIDMTVHAARYGDMGPTDGRVSLGRFPSPEAAIAVVEDKFADLQKTEPELHRHVTVADPRDIRHWHAEGQLVSIEANVAGAQRTVGLFAAAPGAVEWIGGDVVEEEIVLPRFNGQGFAASAQRAWAGQRGRDPDRLLVGTINGLNAASRATAVRAGRPAVLQYVFLSLAA